MKDHIEIRHSFKMTIETGDCSMSEKLLLCNAFDGYEVLKEVSEIVVIDVVSFERNLITLKVSLKEPLTYKEIDEYISDMIEFVREQTNYKIDFEPIGIDKTVFTAFLLFFHPGLQTDFPHSQTIGDRQRVGFGEVLNQIAGIVNT